MLDTFGFPTPQGANYQEFYGGGTVRDWVKPRGASMVRILIIGAGGGGGGGAVSGGGTGGGSGAVTQWIGPAIFIPDVLRISLGAGGLSGTTAGDGGVGDNTEIIYQQKNTTGYVLLTANGGGAGRGQAGIAGPAATVSTNNYFGASGIFKSVAGQGGSTVGNVVSASTTTFLSGGAGGGNSSTSAGGNVNCNYGYPTLTGGAGTTGGEGKNGFFLTQPIIIGVGGSGGGGRNGAAGGKGGNGGIGCGGGGAGWGTSALGGRGGDGAAFIWSW